MAHARHDPTIVVAGPLNHDRITDLAIQHLAPHLAPFLYRQRWFGDKDRTIANVQVRDVAAVEVEGGWIMLAVVVVGFADAAGPADYLVLLTVIPDPEGDHEHQVARVETPAGPWQVADIAAAPAFPAWWLGQFAAEAVMPAAHGRFRWDRLAGFADAVLAAGPGKLITGGLGQSNTTIRYDDAMFAKVFRRLRPGINPDEEISRFLAEESSFRQAPPLYGSALYERHDGTAYPAGVLFGFVQSVGEGWEWTQNVLATVPLPAYADAARRLGERTAQMHIALASAKANPDFVPEPVTDADITGWRQATAAGVVDLIQNLRRRLPALPPAQQPLVAALIEREAALSDRLAGFAALEGTVKTRIHGDYHLGQVLRTPDADWVLLDFEGEPARTIAQRRAKVAPMKDVADMLRSYSNARWLAARRPGADRDRLNGWEQEARAAFLAGYRGEVAGSGIPLVPADDVAFARAVAAWELAKAIYEVRYELGNRPDWLDVPISSLIHPETTAGH